MAKTFDGPPTLERSGSEHRVGRLHPSFLRREGLVRMWSSPCRRDGEVEKSIIKINFNQVLLNQYPDKNTLKSILIRRYSISLISKPNQNYC